MEILRLGLLKKNLDHPDRSDLTCKVGETLFLKEMRVGNKIVWQQTAVAPSTSVSQQTSFFLQSRVSGTSENFDGRRIGSRYVAECALPLINLAGNWALESADWGRSGAAESRGAWGSRLCRKRCCTRRHRLSPSAPRLRLTTASLSCLAQMGPSHWCTLMNLFGSSFMGDGEAWA